MSTLESFLGWLIPLRRRGWMTEREQIAGLLRANGRLHLENTQLRAKLADITGDEKWRHPVQATE